MPLRLGKDVNADRLSCDEMRCHAIGNHTHPVKSIHRDDQAEEFFQGELRFTERSSNTTRCAIKSSGHLAVSRGVELYDSDDVLGGTLRWSVQITDDGHFMIFDEFFRVPVLICYKGGGVGVETEITVPNYAFLLQSEGERLYVPKSDLTTEVVLQVPDTHVVHSGPLAGKTVLQLKEEYQTLSQLLVAMLDLRDPVSEYIVRDHAHDVALELAFIPRSIQQYEPGFGIWHTLQEDEDYTVNLMINGNYQMRLLFERAPRDIKIIR